MPAPLVSVVVPFLDPAPAFFEEAISSVQAQSFAAWELILVDDGSAEPARAVAESFARRDPDRIRCIRHPDAANHGIPTSRNLGIAHARGTYVAFLDADDAWFPEKLEEQLQVLAQFPDAAMVFGRSVYWRSWSRGRRGAGRDTVPALGVPDGTRLRPPSFLHGFMRRKVLTPCPSDIVVRKSALASVGGFQEELPNTFEDQGLYVKLGLVSTVVAVDRVWDRYRIHPDSVLQSAGSAQHILDRRAFLDWVLRYMRVQGHDDRRFRRTVTLERFATRIPGAPRLLRSVRRLMALPSRFRAGLA